MHLPAELLHTFLLIQILDRSNWSIIIRRQIEKKHLVIQKYLTILTPYKIFRPSVLVDQFLSHILTLSALHQALVHVDCQDLREDSQGMLNNWFFRLENCFRDWVSKYSIVCWMRCISSSVENCYRSNLVSTVLPTLQQLISLERTLTSQCVGDRMIVRERMRAKMLCRFGRHIFSLMSEVTSGKCRFTRRHSFSNWAGRRYRRGNRGCPWMCLCSVSLCPDIDTGQEERDFTLKRLL